MKTKIIPVSVTPDAEKSIAYCARVSNPKNQNSESFEGLLKYCIKHQHWSIFEHAFMTVEINTSLAIATQILRHRSFTFQQFSQRYADSTALQLSIPTPDLRSQDTKNRQNSIDDIHPRDKAYMEATIEKHFDDALDLYNSLLKQGVAKECARSVLPLNTTTRLYMSGTIRSWLHYIDLRSWHGTQWEHTQIALNALEILKEQLPTIADAMWPNDQTRETE